MSKIYKFNYHWLNELSKHKDMLDNDTRILVTYIEVLQQENKQLKEEIEEYQYILKTQNEREYYSKFLKDFQKEKGTNVFPDFDEVYKRYDNYKSILIELEEWLKEPEYFNGRRLRQDYITVMTTDVLDKIQELKERYK